MTLDRYGLDLWIVACRRQYSVLGAIMAGRGPQSFKKRQKEQARKEKQQEKLAKRMERRQAGPGETTVEDVDDLGFGPLEPGEAEAAAERSLMNRDRPLTTLER